MIIKYTQCNIQPKNIGIATNAVDIATNLVGIAPGEQQLSFKQGFLYRNGCAIPWAGSRHVV